MAPDGSRLLQMAQCGSKWLQMEANEIRKATVAASGQTVQKQSRGGGQRLSKLSVV